MRLIKNIFIALNVVMLALIVAVTIIIIVSKLTEQRYCDTDFTYVDFEDNQGTSNYCYAGPDGMFCQNNLNDYFQVQIYQEGPLVCKETEDENN